MDASLAHKRDFDGRTLSPAELERHHALAARSLADQHAI
jgi:hypothetical protein